MIVLPTATNVNRFEVLRLIYLVFTLDIQIFGGVHVVYAYMGA